MNTIVRRLLLCLFMVVLAKGSAMAQTLVIWHTDGSTTDVELATEPKVLFSTDKMFVRSMVIDMELDMNDVLRFTYKGNSLDVKQPKAEADYTQQNGQLVFHGVSSTDKVAVYKTNGIRVPVRLLSNGTEISLPLSAIHSGVYLLRVNGKTLKFTRP